MAPWEGLSERIRALRLRRGLTRRALADKLDLSEIFIRKVEAGERLPSLPTLDRIARALGATLNIRIAERRARRRKGG